MRNKIYSSPQQLEQIRHILTALLKLPLTEETISGDLMERVFAHVRNAITLPTYDFVDIIDPIHKIGWQVKSTKASTPVTWIRGKIANRESMITASENSVEALQDLGDAILEYCNAHILHSGFEKYDLDHIGYIRLIVFPDGKLRYFEKHLCSRDSPMLFDPSDYGWAWSEPKKTKGKEQLSALHGFYDDGTATPKKHWAWHGRGENQLHFSGEADWWPESNSEHSCEFKFPDEGKLSFDDLVGLLISRA